MIEIKERNISCSDAKELIGELNTALTCITGNSGASSFNNTDTSDENFVFLILYVDKNPIACGAFRKLSENIAEIKRVYARKNNIGAAHKIVAELEKRALKKGFHEIKLETRKINNHAIDFYLSCGYTKCSNYGKYISREEAICFSKRFII